MLDFPLSVDGHSLLLNCVSMGNPHAVVFLDESVEDFPLTDGRTEGRTSPYVS